MPTVKEVPSTKGIPITKGVQTKSEMYFQGQKEYQQLAWVPPERDTGAHSEQRHVASVADSAKASSCPSSCQNNNPFLWRPCINMDFLWESPMTSEKVVKLYRTPGTQMKSSQRINQSLDVSWGSHLIILCHHLDNI